MKKFSLLLIIILGGLLYYNFPNTNQLFNQQSSQTITQTTTESTTATSTTLENTTEEVIEQVSVSETSPLFNEVLINQSAFPLATTPDVLVGLTNELNDAINAIYQENYTQEQKTINTIQLSKEELTDLEEMYSKDETLSQLNIVVDQVKMELENDDIYVPRIIVPITYQNAERLIEDNDVKILTEAMTFLGNRLVMIAYYDPNTDKLTTYHLTNWTIPLYSHPQE